jgi:hypothetical protein
MREHDYPLPGLEELLRDAADGSVRRVLPPPYELIRERARRRRVSRIATAGGLVVVVAIGVGILAGTRLIAGPAPQPPAHTVVNDPALRPYRTAMPVLVWTPVPGRTPDDVSSAMPFLSAVFAALGPGDHDYADEADIRSVFPDAPVGGPGLMMDQSVTKARLEKAAANIKKVAGVQDANVIEVTGMWFTVSGTSGPITADELDGIGQYDHAGLPKGIAGGAGGSKRLADGRFLWTERVTYFGPALDRATFDLIRARIAAAVRIDPSKVVVQPEHS